MKRNKMNIVDRSMGVWEDGSASKALDVHAPSLSLILRFCMAIHKKER